ncbi:MAG: hypothetical protein Q7N87_01495 [Candidatus Uhrbacteria bacterium]|nr:hypothetical protein [Candidatus Uhrbacteria bacterium]MDP3793533.1 hypothetical protein [Candidatus Uhrbacteria bacterium]
MQRVIEKRETSNHILSLRQGFYLEHVRFFRELAKKHKASFFLFELTAPQDVLLARIKDRMAQKANLATRKPMALSRIMRNINIHVNKEKDSQMRLIDTIGSTPQKIAEKILKEMKNR